MNITTLPLRTKLNFFNGCNSSCVKGKREREKKTQARVGLGQRILISCQTRAGPVQGSISVPLFQLKVPARQATNLPGPIRTCIPCMPATTSLSVYTVTEAYKQTDSTILHLFTYLPHNLCFIPPLNP